MITLIKAGHINIGIRRISIRTMQADHAKGSRQDREQAGSSNQWPRWAQALRDVAIHPEKYKHRVLQVTDEAVVFPDLYPKSKKHVLVLSRMDGLDSLADVGKEHLPLLQHMHNLGEEWVASFLNEDPSLIFRLGYHSVPSMRQLHMHVISQDFDSPCLKNQKHWNSFTTSFFRDSKKVLLELESLGKPTTCTKEEEARLLSCPLRCHRCKCVQNNMVHLKDHIRKCRAALPQELTPYIYTSNMSH